MLEIVSLVLTANDKTVLALLANIKIKCKGE